ncbi:hypothetical protein [Thermostilla marina]
MDTPRDSTEHPFASKSSSDPSVLFPSIVFTSTIGPPGVSSPRTQDCRMPKIGSVTKMTIVQATAVEFWGRIGC